jgi:polysaccharide biosynthesis/export protein
MKLVRVLLLFLFPAYLISCKPQQKIPNYLQNVTDTTAVDSIALQELRIQKNDILSIQIFSSAISPEVDAVYNLPATADAIAGAAGFHVDANGNIEYPKLGTFHAEGLTKIQLATEFKRRLTEPVKLLENPVVLIRFLNLKVTVMGEVNTQGVVTIPGEKVTILEALGLAGGINDYGVKNAVKVIRENNGKREVGIVDLSSKELFDSPYYNLQQNDVVLVDPVKRKTKQADQALVMQRVSFGLSIVTAIALLYNIFQ